MKIQNLIVYGRRWYNKSCGNTYHSVDIIVDGKFIHKTDYAYGYGDQYMTTAADWLEQNGYMPGREQYASTKEVLWQYCERNHIQFIRNVTDVQRKKDL